MTMKKFPFAVSICEVEGVTLLGLRPKQLYLDWAPWLHLLGRFGHPIGSQVFVFQWVSLKPFKLRMKLFDSKSLQKRRRKKLCSRLQQLTSSQVSLTSLTILQPFPPNSAEQLDRWMYRPFCKQTRCKLFASCTDGLKAKRSESVALSIEHSCPWWLKFDHSSRKTTSEWFTRVSI